MDLSKRKQLVAMLSREPEPQVVPIETFFDGNDDLASIGCNLPEHPGMEVFRKTFTRLAKRPDVVAVYAQIAELDPGDGCWPFADTVFVVGSISTEALAGELAALEPDEVGPTGDFDVPAAVMRHGAPALVAWWD